MKPSSTCDVTHGTQ